MTDFELRQKLSETKKQLAKWQQIRNSPNNLALAEQAKEEIPYLEKSLVQLMELFYSQIMLPNFFKLLADIEICREKNFQRESKGIKFARIHADEMIRKFGIVANPHLKCGDPKCPHKGHYHGEKLEPRKGRDGRWQQFVVMIRHTDRFNQNNLCDLCAEFRRKRGEKVNPILKKSPKSAAA